MSEVRKLADAKRRRVRALIEEYNATGLRRSYVLMTASRYLKELGHPIAAEMLKSRYIDDLKLRAKWLPKPPDYVMDAVEDRLERFRRNR